MVKSRGNETYDEEFRQHNESTTTMSIYQVLKEIIEDVTFAARNNKSASVSQPNVSFFTSERLAFVDPVQLKETFLQVRNNHMFSFEFQHMTA